MHDLVGMFVLAFATCVLTVAVILIGLFVGLYRSEQKQFAESVLRRMDRLSDRLAGGLIISEAAGLALSAIEKRTEAPITRVEPVVLVQKPEPVLELSRRSKILKQLELGESLAEISEALGVSLPAIQMMVAVDKMAGRRVEIARKSA